MQNKERSAACPAQVKNACFLVLQIVLESLFCLILESPSFWLHISLRDMPTTHSHQLKTQLNLHHFSSSANR